MSELCAKPGSGKFLRASTWRPRRPCEASASVSNAVGARLLAHSLTRGPRVVQFASVLGGQRTESLSTFRTTPTGGGNFGPMITKKTFSGCKPSCVRPISGKSARESAKNAAFARAESATLHAAFVVLQSANRTVVVRRFSILPSKYRCRGLFDWVASYLVGSSPRPGVN